jgi:antitoxin VapB
MDEDEGEVRRKRVWSERKNSARFLPHLLPESVRMALNIKNPEADRLARALAQATGESITDAVMTAIRERLQRETGRGDAEAVRRSIRAAQELFATGHTGDTRTDEEIIGYDENGIPV